MRTRSAPLRCLAGLALCVALVPNASSQLVSRISYYAEPAFEGLEPMYGRSAPYAITLENQGPDAVGFLRVAAGSYQMDYPVDLPQGAKKRWIVSVPGSTYGDPPSFVLRTNRERFEIPLAYEPSLGPDAIVVGMVTDTTGDLGFLSVNKGDMRQFGGVYCKPEDAPDRPFAYTALNALVLGAGAERLPDEAVRAIQQWVLGGGSLVFVGGASAPVLSDARWSGFLPVRDATVKTFPVTQMPGGGSRELGVVSALVGQPVKGASASRGGLLIRKPMGLGYSVYLATNLFEAPLNRWDRRGELFRQILDPKFLDMAAGVGVATGISGQQDEYYGGTHFHPGYPSEQTANDPFRTELPPTGTILMILLGYLVAVVPLNFVLLKKLGKGELAWLTAPAVSLACAGVFFYAARGLYAANLSTRTAGYIAMAEDAPDGAVTAHTQMFFPQGGRYNLQLENVDSIWVEMPNGYYYNQQQSEGMREMSPVDTGQVLVSAMGTPNLAFRELYLTQYLATPRWLRFEVGRNGIAKLTNASPYKLTSLYVHGAEVMFPVKELDPGQSVSVDLKAGGIAPTRETLAHNASQMARYGGAFVVSANLVGLRVGPQLGEEIASARGLNVLLTTNDRIGGGVR